MTTNKKENKDDKNLQFDLRVEKFKKLLDEGRELVKSIKNPPPPGDYDLGFNARGKKTEFKCSACNGTIEIVYTMNYPTQIIGPAGKGVWTVSKHRCSSCKLLFDL